MSGARGAWMRMNNSIQVSLRTFSTAISLTLPAVSQSIVKDVTPPMTSQPSSDPDRAVTMGGIAYFRATDLLGAELWWRTDATAAGTQRVKDLNPGIASSDPADLASTGTRLFFIADVPGYGRGLFVSDGTAAGTTLARDIHAVADQGSDPRYLTAFQGPSGSTPTTALLAASCGAATARTPARSATTWHPARHRRTRPHSWSGTASCGSARRTALVASCGAPTAPSPGTAVVSRR